MSGRTPRAARISVPASQFIIALDCELNHGRIKLSLGSGTLNVEPRQGINSRRRWRQPGGSSGPGAQERSRECERPRRPARALSTVGSARRTNRREVRPLVAHTPYFHLIGTKGRFPCRPVDQARCFNPLCRIGRLCVRILLIEGQLSRTERIRVPLAPGECIDLEIVGAPILVVDVLDELLR